MDVRQIYRELMNDEFERLRRERGCRTFPCDEKLMRSARDHAELEVNQIINRRNAG